MIMLLYFIFGIILDFLMVFCAILLASFTVLKNAAFTASYVKKSLFSCIFALIIWRIASAFIPSPILIGIIAAAGFGYAINYFFKHGDWFIIYSMSIIFIFIFWLIYSIVLAIIFGRGY